MRKETIEYDVYEVGDVLDISEVEIYSTSSHATKAPSFNACKRALVVGVAKVDGRKRNYHVLCENNKVYIFKASEQGKEKYLKHIDFSDAFSI